MNSMNIKIKYFTDAIDRLAYIDGKSDWIDLRAARVKIAFRKKKPENKYWRTRIAISVKWVISDLSNKRKRKEHYKMRNRSKWILCMGLAFTMAASVTLSGCGTGKKDSGKTEIELVQYKPEAVKAFEKLEEKFNATHDDIHLTIESPNDAMTVLKTRFIREDNPDIIGIGGDINYSNFLDADMLMDISDFEGLNDIKEKYLEMNKDLEYVPKDGVYAVPYMANAAGILFNRDMFEEHGWEVPTTWTEFTNLCDQIQSEGIQPLYFGFKDTWTTLAPWNAIAVSLCDSDLTYQVNSGETTFAENYRFF